MISVAATFIQAVEFAFIGLATAALALLVMTRMAGAAATSAHETAPEVVFLFHRETLVDASEAGKHLLAVAQPAGSDLARLTKLLAPQFPGLIRSLAAKDLRADLTANDKHSILHLKRAADHLRIELQDRTGAPAFFLPDRYALDALTDELKMYRSLGDNTPFPVWRQSPEGQILWANAAYHGLARQLGQKLAEDANPMPIFSENPIFADRHGRSLRMPLNLPRESEPKWFEFQVSKLGADQLIAAYPVDRVVRAERSLKDFVQTLTQTFAHLNVGLAVFNRSRELALFNPALTDLLDLSPEFLISRPTLFQLLDRLRERRLMPEPRNYTIWRQRMSALEEAAADDVYSETWGLIDGRTYRVTGRPHPEGAVAFLFEDISAEISLERKFKSELQISQSVIDGLEEAIAVFSPSGAPLLSNRSYQKLWSAGAGSDDGIHSLVEESRKWQNKCVPTPVWGDVRDFAAAMGERCDWTADVRMRNGRQLDCRFDTLVGGFTLVGFSEQTADVIPDVQNANKATSA